MVEESFAAALKPPRRPTAEKWALYVLLSHMNVYVMLLRMSGYCTQNVFSSKLQDRQHMVKLRPHSLLRTTFPLLSAKKKIPRPLTRAVFALPFTRHAPHRAAAAAAADVASTVAPRAIPPAGRPLPCSRRAACGRCRRSSPPHVPPRCGRAQRAAWPARSERPCAASRRSAAEPAPQPPQQWAAHLKHPHDSHRWRPWPSPQQTLAL
eukprot:365647-Chlamydomonas_euryale.AAC.5